MNVSAPGFPSGLAQRLVRCVRSGEPDVVGDAAVEEVRPLRDPGDVRAPGREVDRRERDPADEDRTRVRLDEAKEEVGGGRLAGAGGPDEGDHPALRDDQVEPVEGGRRPARIGDGHPGERDLGRGRDRDARTAVARDGGRGAPRARHRLVEDREDPLRDRPAGRPRVIARGERAEREEELGDDDQDRQRALELDRRRPSAAG